VVWHPGPQPRYALITSWESSPAIDDWIASQTDPAHLIPVG
jgi:heme-degrading monooxygenase HmoA